MSNILTLPGCTSKSAQDAVAPFKSKINFEAQDAALSDEAVANDALLDHAIGRFERTEPPLSVVQILLKKIDDFQVKHGFKVENVFTQSDIDRTRMELFHAYRRYRHLVGGVKSIEMIVEMDTAIDKQEWSK